MPFRIGKAWRADICAFDHVNESRRLHPYYGQSGLLRREIPEALRLSISARPNVNTTLKGFMGKMVAIWVPQD
ncbi:hypothetical protein DACRYDRAFT_24217 [Dacryopinax primogenitus]|uniref:Uncharacterized protein n=1 Tax=Dacryopinax primogenitus (strain DJM 731) TaxID=1858805 RepID=M5FT95_DACPD|nr:uncharacterized protein DACRYDRAFT_24217 [Dacryopinax primogenitus]EJT98604.1 hypothetical protein DACRYDRAFT_24217 [Dacryopinax primogenitus]